MWYSLIMYSFYTFTSFREEESRKYVRQLKRQINELKRGREDEMMVRITCIIMVGGGQHNTLIHMRILR